MRRILKYAKPYLPMIILSIVLLFGQANAELALPDYLSNIVNVGIQQGGVEDSVPIAISETEMNRTLLFMNNDNQTKVLGYYTLIDENSPNYDKYLEDYPLIEDESIYILNDLSRSEKDEISIVMAKSMLTVFAIKQFLYAPPSEGGSEFDYLLIGYTPGTDFFEHLSNTLTPEQLVGLNEAINAQFSLLGDSMVIQAGVQAVLAEYENLGMDMEKLQRNYMIRIGAIMILLTLLSMAFTISVGYLAAKTATSMAQDIRSDMFEKVESFSSTEFDKFSTASLITRSTNDVTQVQMVIIMIVRLVFYAPIMGIGGIIRALGKASSMWWIIAVAVIVLVCVIMVMFSLALPKFKTIQKLIDRLNLVSRENLTGMMVIRAFNMEDFEENRFDTANEDLTRVNLFINRLMVFMMPFMMLIMNSLMVAIIWFGSKQVADANIQVGDMMAFMQYSMQIVMAFLMMSMMFIMLPRASVSADRIADVLETDLVIKDPENPEKFKEPFQGKIEFNNICFRYPGADTDALHNISFIAEPGKTTAFIGPTGSGKSTLINLIPRFYDVCAGEILIDGIDIRKVSQHDLRDKIGYVPQKSNLFSGTIESNLKYADENASDEMIESAINIAQAREFINSKPQRLETEISQRGANVSGGQKQRLTIARAIVKKPPIYILDDSVSALDFKTDAALRRAFKKHTGNSTLIIVTQRVSTVMNAEQIIVLDEGKIVGKGTHLELLESCETYKEIADSQHILEGLL